LARGVTDIDVSVKKEFPVWFKNHVRKLKNALEDLVSLANGPDRRVIVHGSFNIKGARFRMVAREKNLKTQNSGVMAKVDIPTGNGDEYYGVLQEVLEFSTIVTSMAIDLCSCFIVIGMTFKPRVLR
jgi:hypothetical protein